MSKTIVCIKPRGRKRWVCGKKKFNTPAQARKVAGRRRTRYKLKEV